jgi:iron complex transport system substrate-binding protein
VSRSLIIIALVLSIVPSLTGAAGSTYTDATGVAVRCGLDAGRIVSLAPNVTEMLCFLGLRECLAGRSDFCNYPPEMQAVPSVGGFADASVERIVALAPDLVVAYQGNSRDLVDSLRAAHVTVLALREAASLSEIAEQMDTLWRVAAQDGAAVPPQLATWRERLAKLTADVGDRPRPRVFFGYPGELSMTCAPGSFLDDLIARAGGISVVPAGRERWPTVSAEFVVRAAPQWMLTATSCSGRESVAEKRSQLLRELEHDKVWSTLPAVRDGHVLVLDSDVLLRPGPRILDALAEVQSALAGGKESQ